MDESAAARGSRIHAVASDHGRKTPRSDRRPARQLRAHQRIGKELSFRAGPNRGAARNLLFDVGCRIVAENKFQMESIFNSVKRPSRIKNARTGCGASSSGETIKYAASE